MSPYLETTSGDFGGLLGVSGGVLPGVPGLLPLLMSQALEGMNHAWFFSSPVTLFATTLVTISTVNFLPLLAASLFRPSDVTDQPSWLPVWEST